MQDSPLFQEVEDAVACAGFPKNWHEGKVVQEAIGEQVTLLVAFLSLAQDRVRCVFAEVPSISEDTVDRYPRSVWIATSDTLFCLDISSQELRMSTGFRIEVLPLQSISEVVIVARSWYDPTPSSASTASLEFSAQGRTFRLNATGRNCERLRSIARIFI